MLLWGTNPPVSHFTFMHAIEEGLKGEAKLVVIDPRSAEISRKEEPHLRPVPRTNGALAWGSMRRPIETGQYDREFVAGHSVGFQQASAYAQENGVNAVRAIACLGGSSGRWRPCWAPNRTR
ncbi:MAG: molybdopterin-dependent oxidoreductase [Spirochaetales bacterium]|nr:molybdopterin-dependent oxidoreductase [Spirochaetales bacterium]